MPTLEKPELAIDEPRRASALPPDALAGRLRRAFAVSVVVNLVVWTVAAQVVRHHVLPPPAPIEMTRVILAPPPKVEKKKPTPPKPKAVVPPPKRLAPPTPKTAPRPAPIRRAAPVPQAHIPQAHNRVLLAPKTSAPSPHVALPGGNAPVGRPTARQAPGNAAVNPPTPPVPPAPEPAPTPKPTPPAPPPLAPKPEPPPKPSGPTRDAEPSNQAKPDIPDELKSDSYKSYVRVQVEIDADGSASPTLRTSSGNAEIDRRVLDALKRWKWKPALENGQPVKSVQRFRFEFEVQ